MAQTRCANTRPSRTSFDSCGLSWARTGSAAASSAASAARWTGRNMAKAPTTVVVAADAQSGPVALTQVNDVDRDKRQYWRAAPRCAARSSRRQPAAHSAAAAQQQPADDHQVE